MTIQEHYQRGFMAKMAQAGVSEDDVRKMIQALALKGGVGTEEDTPENDYKSGIGDTLRNIWKPNSVMAHKQRRFERDYNKKSGLGKIWAKLKHPRRATEVEGISGAAPALSALLAGAIAARWANINSAAALSAASSY